MSPGSSTLGLARAPPSGSGFRARGRVARVREDPVGMVRQKALLVTYAVQ